MSTAATSIAAKVDAMKGVASIVATSGGVSKVNMVPRGRPLRRK